MEESQAAHLTRARSVPRARCRIHADLRASRPLASDSLRFHPVSCWIVMRTLFALALAALGSLSCAGDPKPVIDRASALRNETLPPPYDRLRPLAGALPT